IPHIATGDIFRQAIKDKTPLGVKVMDYLDKGQLVPDELTDDLVNHRLQQEDAKEGFLLDGYPRSINQAHALDGMLKKLNTSLDVVINIDIPFDVLTNRIVKRRICKNCGATYHLEYNPPSHEGICDKCGGPLYQRSDDNEETVIDRLEVYNKQTKPLIEYYTNEKKLVNVNGLQSFEDVFKDIQVILEGLE
ncbi:MAG: adenylate kinase, partial [Bacilli bacterium]